MTNKYKKQIVYLREDGKGTPVTTLKGGSRVPRSLGNNGTRLREPFPL